MMTYPMHVAGLVRDLPICKVTEDFYIGAFIMFGDAELTVACARDLLKLAEERKVDAEAAMDRALKKEPFEKLVAEERLALA